ncbi:hypothetical protein KLP28_15185 [Nocardioidaceae bacterium]|nr:hypothetical protein KLP28_15185 [Nocardioidaceae bacterium]
MSTKTTRLREAVERFADAPPAGAEPSRTPPAELMRTLRRRQRRRRTLPAYVPALAAAASVIAVVVGLVAGLPVLLTGDDRAAVTGQTSQDLPAPEKLVGAIPDRVEEPGRWIDVDPAPGVAAAVVGGSEGPSRLPWGTGEPGVAVVSARTGAYTWLELPLPEGRDVDVRGGDVSLSPTGRFLAYWAAADGVPGPYSRFVVRDLVTGTERSWRPEDQPGGIQFFETSWVGAEKALVTFSRSVGDGEGEAGVPVVFDAVSGAVRQVGGTELARSIRTGFSVPGNPLVAARGDGASARLVEFALDGAIIGRYRQPLPTGGLLGAMTISPSRTSIVSIEVNNPDPRLEILHRAGVEPYEPGDAEQADVGIDDAEREGEIVETEPSAALLSLIGWRDDRHVLAEAAADRGADASTSAAYRVLSVDVRTGRSQSLTQVRADATFASDLWARPTLSRDVDASPSGPYRVVGGVLVLVVGVVAIRFARRRRAGGGR